MTWLQYIYFSGRGNDKDEDHSGKEHLWIIAVVLSVVIALAGIATACIIYHYR